MKKNAISYEKCRSTTDLKGICSLQQQNIPTSLKEREMQSDGFLTVIHDLELLTEMNVEEPHILAKDGNKVVGYALSMTQTFRNRIPVLIPMFDKIDELFFENRSLKSIPYIVMGQICIDKAYRQQGIFKNLYKTMVEDLMEKGKFEMLITEVSVRNKRSFNAHFAAGFKTLNNYSVEGGDTWDILYINLKK